MGNRTLTSEELKTLFSPFLQEVRGKLKSLSGGDSELLFALRRKLYKELSYDERGKPMHRKLLKAAKYAEQLGKCANCGSDLEKLGKNAVLDRAEAIRGYVSYQRMCDCFANPVTANCKLSAITPDRWPCKSRARLAPHARTRVARPGPPAILIPS
jgi:hypothetical protein